jgi:DNA-binding NtrC family response regulator
MFISPPEAIDGGSAIDRAAAAHEADSRVGRILVVEDEPAVRGELRRLLTRAGHDVAEAGTVSEAEVDRDLASFDVILTDLRLPGPAGTELIARAPEVPVVVMTSYATVRSAVEAMRMGAADYLAKPFDHDEMLLVLGRVLEQGKRRRALAPAEPPCPSLGLIGTSPVMRAVVARIDKVAPTDVTVLVRGESGTGKELVARALHARSARATGPFIAVNCAAIPDGLVESELFGHEKGAFTGAAAMHAGLVEAADGGTLFLDEIGELPCAAQARLLRFLQDSEVRRVGATRARRVDVRVVAATHRDLPRLVATGAFRDDLYYRLRVVEVLLPPLRERGDDVIELADHLLARVAHRLGRGALILSDAAVRAIRAHPWPGNVRELDNAIERAAILCDHCVITPDLLALEEDTGHCAVPELAASVGGASLEDYFRRFVFEHQVHLSETELARRLGISRKALWERRQRMGIPRAQSRHRA